MLYFSSDLPLFHRIHQTVHAAPGEGHDGEGGIFVRVGGEGAAVGDQEVFDVPGAAFVIHHGVFGIAAHAGGADLVDDLAGAVDGFGAVVLVNRSEAGAAHAFDDGLEGAVHMAGLVQLVLAPLPVEAQHRNAPLIHHVG